MSIPDLTGVGPVPASDPSPSTQAVVDGIFTAAATGVLEDVLAWWADDGVLEDVTLARAFTGKTELLPYLDWYFKALPDLNFTPARILVDGPHAAVEWAQICHQTGPFDGIPGDGREFRLRALYLFEIRNGNVQH